MSIHEATPEYKRQPLTLLCVTVQGETLANHTSYMAATLQLENLSFLICLFII